MSSAIKYAAGTNVVTYSVTLAPAGLAVDDLAALAALDDDVIPPFSAVAVKSLIDEFVLVPGTTVAAHPTLAITAASGDNQWIRRCLPAAFWASRSAFWIAGDGDDEAEGLADSPLATIAEVMIRVGRLPLPNTRLFVHLLSVTADPVAVVIDIDPTATLIIDDATPTPAASFDGTISSFQTSSGSANRWTNFIDLAQPAFVSPTSGPQLLTITSGPRAGARAWVAHDLASGRVRTSHWNNTTFAFGSWSYESVTPQNGDEYEARLDPLPWVTTLILKSGNLQIVRLYTAGGVKVPLAGLGASCTVSLLQCRIGPDTAFSNVVNCVWDNVCTVDLAGTSEVSPPVITDSLLLGLVVKGAGQLVLYDTLSDSTFSSGSGVTVHEGSTLIVRSPGLGSVGFALYIASLIDTGVVVRRGAVLRCEDDARLFGATSNTDGVRVYAGARVEITGANVPTMTRGVAAKDYAIGENAQSVTFAAARPTFAADGSGAKILVA